MKPRWHSSSHITSQFLISAVLLIFFSTQFTDAKPLNLPQTITCADNIYVYVNETTADRSPYIFVEIKTATIHDCINSCFGNQFCYSLRYDQSKADSCSLFYFAAYNCTGQALVPAKSVVYNGGAVTIDCLRCPSNGDFVTAPPFTSFTEQTITAVGKKGETLIEKPLVEEITHNIDSKLESTTSTPSGHSTAIVDLHVEDTTTVAPESTTTSSSSEPIASTETAQTVQEDRKGSKKIPPSAKTTVSFQEEEKVTTQATNDESTTTTEKTEESTTEVSSTTDASSGVESTTLAESNDPEPAVATKVEMAKDKEGIKTTLRKHCVIKFQARPLSDRPENLKAKFELNVPVDSIELCATRCYQDGCSGAKFDPADRSCTLSYDDPQFCARGNVFIHYEAKEATWLHCVNCYTVKQSDIDEVRTGTTSSPSKESETTTVTTQATPSDDATTTLNSEESTTEQSTTTSSESHEISTTTVATSTIKSSEEGSNDADFQRGCLIKFQARPLSERPREFSAKFETEIKVDSVEVCATRCYQDGCSGARFDPVWSTCSLSYDEKHYCARGDVFLQYMAKEVTWIHCVNCYAIKSKGSSDVPKVPSKVNEDNEITTTTEASVTNPWGETEGTLSGEEKITTTSSPKESTTLKTIGQEGDDDSLLKGCIVHFQSQPIEERKPEFTAPFEMNLKVPTAEICAHRCYQDGCTAARYDPSTQQCSLAYEDKPFCGNGRLVNVDRSGKTIWIHCLSCVPLKSSKVAENIDEVTESPITVNEGSGEDATTPTTAEATISEASGEETTTAAVTEASGEEPSVSSTSVPSELSKDDQVTEASGEETTTASVTEASGEEATTVVVVAGVSGEETTTAAVTEASGEETTTIITSEITETTSEAPSFVTGSEIEIPSSEDSETTTTHDPNIPVITPKPAVSSTLLSTDAVESSTSSSSEETAQKKIVGDHNTEKESGEKKEEDLPAFVTDGGVTTEEISTTTPTSQVDENANVTGVEDENIKMAKELGKQFAADLAKLAGKDGVNQTSTSEPEGSGEVAQSENEKTTISSLGSIETVKTTTVAEETTTVESSGEEDDDKPAFVTGEPLDSTTVASETLSSETTTSPNEVTKTIVETVVKVSTVSPDETESTTTISPESSGEEKETSTLETSADSISTPESSGEELEQTTTESSSSEPSQTTVASVEEASGEESIKTEILSTTTSEVEGSGVTGAESKDEDSSTTESPSFVTAKTSVTSGSEEDEEESADTTSFLTGIDESMFNKSLIGDTHREDLPNNVGFVPSSEPKPKSEDEDEDEEEDSGTKISDYEDNVSKKDSTTSTPTTTTTEISGTTTEPPVQLVKDLIDALAAGGLDFVLGRPRKPTSQAAQDLINRKLGPIQRLLPQSIDNKHECTTGRVRFVASETIDLSQHFERDAVAFSLEHCARMCYETSCLRAAFTRFPRPVCLMHYADQKTAHLDTNCTDVTPTSTWTFTKINQVVAIDCVTCAEEKKAHDITSFSVDEPSSSADNIPLHQGVSSKCDGRVEFQVIPVASLPKLNITNDVPASSPADCARKCFETEHCKTAGFIPSPSGTIAQGVCLLTSDDVVCGNLADFVPQHAALHPFVVSCIRCTSCTYNIRPVTPTRTMPTMKVHEKAENVQECAKLCSDMKCTMAKYENNTKICSMTREPVTGETCPQEVATQIHDSLLPISLECVKCSEV